MRTSRRPAPSLTPQITQSHPGHRHMGHSAWRLWESGQEHEVQPAMVSLRSASGLSHAKHSTSPCLQAPHKFPDTHTLHRSYIVMHMPHYTGHSHAHNTLQCTHTTHITPHTHHKHTHHACTHTHSDSSHIHTCITIHSALVQHTSIRHIHKHSTHTHIIHSQIAQICTEPGLMEIQQRVLALSLPPMNPSLPHSLPAPTSRLQERLSPVLSAN